MPRTKGSKNKPKTVTADFATQIAEKQSAKETLTAEIASITANIDTLKADLKEKKTALKKAEKEVATLEAKKAKADAKAAEEVKEQEDTSPYVIEVGDLASFVQAVGECGFGQSGGNLCFDNFKSYSGSSKMQSCHDLSGIRDFSTGSGSRYLLYGILSDIRNAGKMLGKRAGNF